MTNSNKDGHRIILIDPTGDSEYSKVGLEFDSYYESYPGRYVTMDPSKAQALQDPATELPGGPNKYYRIVLPEGFNHNDYEIFGPSDQ